MAVAVPKFLTAYWIAMFAPDGATDGDIQPLPASSGSASVVDVVDVVGIAGMELLVVPPGLVVLVVVGTAAVLLVVVGTTPVVVEPALVVWVVVDAALVVVLVEPGPPLVVEVVGVVGVVVVLEPPGWVVELGPVVPDTVVVVVAPAHVHWLQSAPHGPSPASHASPASGSQMPSPQRLSDPRNGFAMPAVLAVKVAASVRHCSVMVATRIALPVIAGQDFHRARIFVPWLVARTLAFTGGQPLSTDTMRPATSTTSGDVASSPGMSAEPATR